MERSRTIDPNPMGELYGIVKSRKDTVYSSISQAYNERAPEFYAAEAILASRKNSKYIGMSFDDVKAQPIESLTRTVLNKTVGAAAEIYYGARQNNVEHDKALALAKQALNADIDDLAAFSTDRNAFNDTIRRTSWIERDGRGGYKPRDGGEAFQTFMDEGVDIGSSFSAFARKATSWTGASSVVRAISENESLIQKAIDDNLGQADDRMLSQNAARIATVGAAATMIAEMAALGAIGGSAFKTHRLMTAAATKGGALTRAGQALTNNRASLFFLSKSAISDYAGDVGMGRRSIKSNDEQDTRYQDYVYSRLFDWATITTSMGLSSALSRSVSGKLMAASRTGHMLGVSAGVNTGVDVAFDVATDYAFFNAMSRVFDPSDIDLTADYIRQFGDTKGIGRDFLFRMGIRGGSAMFRFVSPDNSDKNAPKNITSAQWWRDNDLAKGFMAEIYAGVWRATDPTMRDVVNYFDRSATVMRPDPADPTKMKPLGTFAERFKSGEIDSYALTTMMLYKERETNKLFDDIFNPDGSITMPSLIGRIFRPWIKNTSPLLYGEIPWSDTPIGVQKSAIDAGNFFIRLDVTDESARDYYTEEARHAKVKFEGTNANAQDIASYIQGVRRGHVVEYTTRPGANEAEQRQLIDTERNAYSDTFDGKLGLDIAKILRENKDASKPASIARTDDHEKAFLDIVGASRNKLHLWTHGVYSEPAYDSPNDAIAKEYEKLKADANEMVTLTQAANDAHLISNKIISDFADEVSRSAPTIDSLLNLRRKAAGIIQDKLLGEMAAVTEMLSNTKIEKALKTRALTDTVQRLTAASGLLGRYMSTDFYRASTAFFENKDVSARLDSLFRENRAEANKLFSQDNATVLKKYGIDPEKEGMTKALVQYMTVMPFARIEQREKIASIGRLPAEKHAPSAAVLTDDGKFTDDMLRADIGGTSGSFSSIDAGNTIVIRYKTTSGQSVNSGEITSTALRGDIEAMPQTIIALSDHLDPRDQGYSPTQLREMTAAAISKLYHRLEYADKLSGSTRSHEQRIDEINAFIRNNGADGIIRDVSYDSATMTAEFTLDSPNENIKRLGSFAESARIKPPTFFMRITPDPLRLGKIFLRKYKVRGKSLTFDKLMERFGDTKDIAYSPIKALEIAAKIYASNNIDETVDNLVKVIKRVAPDLGLEDDLDIRDFAYGYVAYEYPRVGLENSINQEVKARHRGVKGTSTLTPYVRVVSAEHSDFMTLYELDTDIQVDTLAGIADNMGLVSLPVSGPNFDVQFVRMHTKEGVAGATKADEAKQSARQFVNWIRQSAEKEATIPEDESVFRHLLKQIDVDEDSFVARVAAKGATDLAGAYKILLFGDEKFTGLLPRMRTTYENFDWTSIGVTKDDAKAWVSKTDTAASNAAKKKLEAFRSVVMDENATKEMLKGITDTTIEVLRDNLYNKHKFGTDAFWNAYAELIAHKDRFAELHSKLMTEFDKIKIEHGNRLDDLLTNTTIIDLIKDVGETEPILTVSRAQELFPDTYQNLTPVAQYVQKFMKQVAIIDRHIRSAELIKDTDIARRLFVNTMVYQGAYFTTDETQKRASAMSVHSSIGSSPYVKDIVDDISQLIDSGATKVRLIFGPEVGVGYPLSETQADGAAFMSFGDRLFNLLFGSREGGMKHVLSTPDGTSMKFMALNSAGFERDSHASAVFGFDTRRPGGYRIRPNDIVINASMAKMITPSFMRALGISPDDLKAAASKGRGVPLLIKNLSGEQFRAFIGMLGIQAERITGARDVKAAAKQIPIAMPIDAELMNDLIQSELFEQRRANLVSSKFTLSSSSSEINNKAQSVLDTAIEIPGVYGTAAPHFGYDFNDERNRSPYDMSLLKPGEDTDGFDVLLSTDVVVNLARNIANNKRAARKDILRLVDVFDKWDEAGRPNGLDATVMGRLLDLIVKHGEGAIIKNGDDYYVGITRMPNQNYGQFSLARLSGIRGSGFHTGIEISLGIKRILKADFDGDNLMVVPIPFDIWNNHLKRHSSNPRASFAEMVRKRHEIAMEAQEAAGVGITFSFDSINLDEATNAALYEMKDTTSKVIGSTQNASIILNTQLSLSGSQAEDILKSGTSVIEESIMAEMDPGNKGGMRTNRPATIDPILVDVDHRTMVMFTKNNASDDWHGGVKYLAQSSVKIDDDRDIRLISVETEDGPVGLLLENDGEYFGERMIGAVRLADGGTNQSSVDITARSLNTLLVSAKLDEAIQSENMGGFIFGTGERIVSPVNIFSQNNSGGTDTPKKKGAVRQYYTAINRREDVATVVSDFTRKANIAALLKLGEISKAGSTEYLLDSRMFNWHQDMTDPIERRGVRKKASMHVNAAIDAISTKLDRDLPRAEITTVLASIAGGDPTALHNALNVVARRRGALAYKTSSSWKYASPVFMDAVSRLTLIEKYYENVKANRHVDVADHVFDAPAIFSNRRVFEPMGTFEAKDDVQLTDDQKWWNEMVKLNGGRALVPEDVIQNVFMMSSVFKNVYGEDSNAWRMYINDLHGGIPIAINNRNVRSINDLAIEIQDTGKKLGFTFETSDIIHTLNEMGITVMSQYGTIGSLAQLRLDIADGVYAGYPGGGYNIGELVPRLIEDGKLEIETAPVIAISKNGELMPMRIDALVSKFNEIYGDDIKNERSLYLREKKAAVFEALLSTIDAGASDTIRLRSVMGISEDMAIVMSELKYEGARITMEQFRKLTKATIMNPPFRRLDAGALTPRMTSALKENPLTRYCGGL